MGKIDSANFFDELGLDVGQARPGQAGKFIEREADESRG